MFGSSPFATTPFSTEPGPDLSVLAPFSDLVRNPDAERLLILDGEFWDQVFNTLRSVGYGGGEDFDTRTFNPYLVDAVNYETRLFDSIGGIRLAGAPTTGDIALAFGDGNLDKLCGYSPQGQLMRVLLGFRGFTFGQFEPVFIGTAQHATWTLNRYSIALRDPSTKLDLPVQTHRYLGTGALEGAADLKDVLKPKGWGPFWNVPAVLIDRAALIYQAHDGSMDSITGVFDRAVALTFSANYADEAALRAAVVAGGSYATCLALGIFRLGGAPAGLVTCDGTGDNVGGYVDTAAGIHRRVTQAQGGTPDSGLNLASYAALDVAQPARVGIWVNGEASVAAVGDAILASIFGWRTFERTGEIAVGRLEFTTPVATLGSGEIVDIFDVAAISTETPELPFYRRSLGYRRAIAVQGAEDVAAGATDAQKSFVEKEFRRAPWEDLTVKTGNPLAEQIDLDTLLADEADAQAEADRQGALLGTLRNLYAVTVKGWQFLLRPGQTVTLKYHRFGLSAGRDFVIVKLGENTSTRRTSLTLWG